MDPSTRTVAPNWRAVASSLGVCGMTLAKSIRRLKAGGLIATVMAEPSDGDSIATDAPRFPNSFKRYVINESVDAGWAASVEPRFRAAHSPYRHTKAERDAGADERLAGRIRLVMDDLLGRMDPATRRVAPRIRELIARQGHGLNVANVARAVRVLKAAGVVSVVRNRTDSAENHGGLVFEVSARALHGLDCLRLARAYRPSTVRSERGRDTPAPDDLGERILAYLREKADPATGLVAARHSEICTATGFSQNAVSRAMLALAASSRIAKVTGKPRRGLGRSATLYRILPPTLAFLPLSNPAAA